MYPHYKKTQFFYGLNINLPANPPKVKKNDHKIKNIISEKKHHLLVA
jgi:hypothetical protein